jgi:hypothetical protein
MNLDSHPSRRRIGDVALGDFEWTFRTRDLNHAHLDVSLYMLLGGGFFGAIVIFAVMKTFGK